MNRFASLVFSSLFLLAVNPAWAEKTNCKISSTVLVDKNSCESFITRLWAMSEEECLDYANASKVTGFFNVLRPEQRVLNTTITFKTQLRKVRQRFIFEDTVRLCR